MKNAILKTRWIFGANKTYQQQKLKHNTGVLKINLFAEKNENLI